MRLWSIHPRYLDSKGLVALWREALLAQKVLLGSTNGYKHHPQLSRFKNTANPPGAIATYLRHVMDAAGSRDFRFDGSRIVNKRYMGKLLVTDGQLEYEFTHLLAKLKLRAPDLYRRLRGTTRIDAHPMFRRVRGRVEDWEIISK